MRPVYLGSLLYIYKGLNYQVIQGLFHKQIKRIPIKQPRIQWNVSQGFDHCSVGSCACGSCVEQLDWLEIDVWNFPNQHETSKNKMTSWAN